MERDFFFFIVVHLLHLSSVPDMVLRCFKVLSCMTYPLFHRDYVPNKNKLRDPLAFPENIMTRHKNKRLDSAERCIDKKRMLCSKMSL